MSVRQRILESIKQRPFQPFRIVLSNGHVHDIRHPEMVWVTPYYVLGGMPDPTWDGPGAFVDSTMSAMIHIAEVVPLPGVAPSKEASQ
jgi:hypothetical protein